MKHLIVLKYLYLRAQLYFNLPPSGTVCVWLCVCVCEREREKERESVCVCVYRVYGGAYGYSCAMRGM